MCLYTPQGTKKRSHGSSTTATKPSTRTPSTRPSRATLPRNITINQPGTIIPPIIVPQYQQPRIEIGGADGETTNIYLPPPAPTQGQAGGGQGQSGQAQGNGERRKSSLVVTEVEGVMRLARRVGDAVRRGSAGSFGRERERRRERSRERRSHRDRGRRERSMSSERSGGRSRERRTMQKQLKVVDEEARQMARFAGGMVEGLLREREVKREAKRLLERKQHEEERLADRVVSRYGPAGLLAAPPPAPPNWRDAVNWAPWNNANAYGNNAYIQAPPPPPPPPPSQSRRDSGERDRRSGERRDKKRDGDTGTNIHVHTAPLVQGPQISTSTPGSAGSAEMPGMWASSASGQRRGSWAEPMRRLLERGIGGYGGMPVQTFVTGGVNPIHGMGGMGMGGMGMGMGMGGVQAVPIGEREWQRARVYGSHHEPGLGGMMY